MEPGDAAGKGEGGGALGKGEKGGKGREKGRLGEMKGLWVTCFLIIKSFRRYLK